jgi:hypothetical protein
VPHGIRVGTFTCRFADGLCSLVFIDEAAEERSSPDPLAGEVDDRSRDYTSLLTSTATSASTNSTIA